MNFIIYKITNLINGKIYIGKHETKNINDNYFGSGKLIRRAIRKYGISNFKKEILFKFSSREEMNAKEKELVNIDFIKSKKNYNLTIGGDGGWFHCNGENHNNKHNHRRIGFLQYLDKGINTSLLWYNQLSLEEQKEYKNKISLSLKKYIAQNGFWWCGKKHSNMAKKKMSETSIKNKCQFGEKNSQYGTMWIYNNETLENKKINKTEVIPIGWSKGRIGNKKLNKIKKEKSKEEKIIYLRRLHKEYVINGFEGVVKKFNYKFSQQNLVKQFSKYLKEFIPQNGKRRKQ